MAVKPPASTADAALAKLESKKLLIFMILATVVAVMLVVVAVLVALMMFQPAAGELGPDGQPVAQEAAAAAQPIFMPLENMVVNLADPRSMRLAQIGVTLQLADSSTADRITVFMPAIRNNMLRLTSQRAATELLTPAGKDALATDMLGMIRETTGLPDRGTTPSPVQAVLFTSLIVQ